MIKVDRTRISMPDDLADGAQSPAGKERKKTDEFYAKKRNREKPYDKYSAYKRPAVIKALNDLFLGKCAYCETLYAATQPTDVEHFRPKGGVVIEVVQKGVVIDRVFTRPGYYWLAATWENLLPSCIDCNRERKQDFNDKTTGKSGKANHFPLSKETYRAPCPDDIKREKRAGLIKREERYRLLLNPCSDEPDEHLFFNDDGEVEAAALKNGKPSPKGLKSISVYGLNRIYLTALRCERAKDTLAIIARIKRLEERIQLDPQNLFGFKEELLEEMARLKGYGQRDRKYAGMVRQLVRRHYGDIEFDPPDAHPPAQTATRPKRRARR